MKADIHPDYVVSTVTCSCGNTFETRSTKPELHVEICANCHPFYTGKQKLLDSGGRVERFQRRLERAGQSRRRSGMSNDRRAGRPRGRDDARPVELGRRRAQARRRIAEVCRPIASVMARHRLARLPVVRGVVALGESLAIGFRALAISANYAAQEEGEEGEPEQEITRGQMIFAFAVAIAFVLLVFKVGPALIVDKLVPVTSGTWFVIIEGAVRVTIFVALPLADLAAARPQARLPVPRGRAQGDQRLRGRRGARRREGVQRYSLIHPRCGTAFLLWVMVIAIFVFAFFGRPAWYWLIVTRILLLPLIAGIAYELIRFAGKHQDNRVLMTLLAPGLWLQRLTTRQPSLDQLEVSIRALQEVLTLERRRSPEAERVEVMA